MTISSHVLKKCTFSLSKNINSYDPDEFAEKIVSKILKKILHSNIITQFYQINYIFNVY